MAILITSIVAATLLVVAAVSCANYTKRRLRMDADAADGVAAGNQNR